MNEHHLSVTVTTSYSIVVELPDDVSAFEQREEAKRIARRKFERGEATVRPARTGEVVWEFCSSPH
jgi:hypothetical protein